MTEKSKYYEGTSGDSYFDWEKDIGEFSGWACLSDVSSHIEPQHDVLDFGCGGGYLLEALQCRRKSGVEVNPAAVASARERGLEIFTDVSTIPDESFDVIISMNAIEHTMHPLHELRALRRVLRRGGRAVFFTSCETPRYRYGPNDLGHHLYSWSPQSLGNLFTEAGFRVLSSRPNFSKWPPGYRMISKLGGRPLFSVSCRIFSYLEYVMHRATWISLKLIAER
jgi:SAM-dependent methyltransferase